MKLIHSKHGEAVTITSQDIESPVSLRDLTDEQRKDIQAAIRKDMEVLLGQIHELTRKKQA